MPEDIIGLLNKDLEGEHAAIIQYLTHAYAIGEGELACEIEAIAREEMRHLDWLAETIVNLKGTPSFKRGEMRKLGKAIASWMTDDVHAGKTPSPCIKSTSRLLATPRLNGF